MLALLTKVYFRYTLDRPWVAIALVALLLLVAASQVRHFHLDASAESLMLESSEDMRFYRELRARYGSDDYLIVTYTPQQALFSDGTLLRLTALRDELRTLERVDSVMSILDVPLLDSPRVTFSDVQDGVRTLEDNDTDRNLAREEFRSSPLYRDLLMNRDADTTALILIMARDDQAQALLARRDALRTLQGERGLDDEESVELLAVSEAYARIHARQQANMANDVAEVRSILARHRSEARIHLGGAPMIAVDMVEFVENDIRTFGIGVALFIIALLAIAFRQLRWVLVPSVVCGGVALGMVGFLGLMGWPVTVVSSNFISLVLILTLSLIVHLVVRQRELHMVNPYAASVELMRGTVASKFKPSLFTALTTVVAFGSMLFAEIRPIMDFGLMMVCAVVFGFILTFVLFPALLAPFAPGPVPQPQKDVTSRVIQGLGRFTDRSGLFVGVLFVTIAVVSGIGVTRVTVENRFIDYFKSSTEIYQGMELIDRELGGTTPLDVVLEPSAQFLAYDDEDDADWDDWDDWDELDDFGYGDVEDQRDGPVGGYWFTSLQLEELEKIRAYLDGLPETGKILSVATSMQLITQLNQGQPLEGIELAVMYDRLPNELRRILFDPYMSDDGNQMRFDIRVIDSDPNLERDALLRQIRTDLMERFDLQPEQVRLSGMLVLYNGVMQSLLRSQFVTMFVVFGAMVVMFGLLFRSIRMAIIGPLPTLVAAVSVLGLMGWVGIPLDIMTMTIAAITIGIGVHDTIHYTDRFSTEIAKGADYATAMHASHASVGRAMIFTTVIVVAGFSILTLSNFMPTIYFGVLTGVSMIFALLSNLMLLPLLLQRLRPFGPADGERPGA